MFIVRLLLWIVATLIVMVVAAVLYLSYADLNWLKPRIEAMVADATGRQLTLAGNFDLDLVPAPALLLESVSFGNASWGAEPALAQVGHLSARIDLLSVLSGPLRIKQVRLRDVDVFLETNDKGEGNWVMGGKTAVKAAEQPESAVERGPPAPILVDFAELRNITLRLQAPQQEAFQASVESFDVSTDQGGFTVLDGKGQVKDLPLLLAGKLGPASALASGRDVSIDLSTSLGKVNATVKGKVGNLADAAGLNLETALSSDDIGPILQRFGVELPLSGPLRVDTAVSSVDTGTRVAVDAKVAEIAATLTATHAAEAVDFEVKVPALTKVGETLKIADLPPGDLSAKGRLAMDGDVLQLQGIDIRLDKTEVNVDGTVRQEDDKSAAEFAVKAQGPSLGALNAALPNIGFTASLNARIVPKHIVLDKLKTTFGDSDLAGDLDITLDDAPVVKGKLSSKSLDLSPFTAAGEGEAKQEQKKAEVAADQQPAEQERQPKSKYVFVDEALPFDVLKQGDIDLRADIGQLTVDNIVLLDIATAVDLKGGNLQMTNSFRGPEGGRAMTEIALTTSGETAKIDAKVNLRDLRLNLLSGDVDDPQLVPPIAVTVDLNSVGNTPRALASSTNGRVLLTQGPGQIKSGLLNSVSGDVFAELIGALNPFSKTDEFTHLDCTIVALDFKDGEGTFPGMYIQGEKIKIDGKGGIDLNDESLDIEFNTKPREGIGISADMFVTPFVKLVGTLASPSVGLAKTGTVLAVATGGMSVLAQAAVDRAAGAVDSCAAVLEDVGDHPPLKE